MDTSDILQINAQKNWINILRNKFYTSHYYELIQPINEK